MHIDHGILDMFPPTVPTKNQRDKEAEARARGAVLAALRANPHGLTRKQLMEIGGASVLSRIGELRDAGWVFHQESPGAPFILVGGSPRSAQVLRRQVVTAVKVRHLGDGTVEVKPYHHNSVADFPASEALAATLEPLVGVWLDAGDAERQEIQDLVAELSRRLRARSTVTTRG